MRIWMLLACALLLAPGLTVAGDDPGRETDGEQEESAQDSGPKTLGVEEFMKNVDEHRGEVRVEGIVSAVTPNEKMIALIDLKEFEHCGVTTCAAFTLPVRWTGEMPSVEDHVRVEGSVRESDGKLVFAARDLAKMKKRSEERK